MNIFYFLDLDNLSLSSSGKPLTTAIVMPIENQFAYHFFRGGGSKFHPVYLESATVTKDRSYTKLMQNMHIRAQEHRLRNLVRVPAPFRMSSAWWEYATFANSHGLHMSWNNFSFGSESGHLDIYWFSLTWKSCPFRNRRYLNPNAQTTNYEQLVDAMP